MIRVSVVTPSFNQADFLEQNIVSVRRQLIETEYLQVEHIVVDGGSTDGTLQILKRSPSVRWVSEKDQGQSDALNKGLRMATGGILGWLNSDDTYEPGAIAFAAEFFQKFPEVDLIYGLCAMIDEKDRVLKVWDPPDFNLNWLIRNGISTIPQPTVFFRRRVWEDTGDLDMRLHYAMDYDYWIRVARGGYLIRKVPQVLARFRLHQASKSVRAERIHSNESYAVRAKYCEDDWFAWLFGYCDYKGRRAVTKLIAALRSRSAF